MAGSWRHILHSATGNPRIDRGAVPPSQGQHRAPGPATRQHPPAQYHSAAQARSLLERELEAFSGRLAEEGQAAPASARPVADVRPPAPPGMPAGYRPAPPPVQPAGYRAAPPAVQPPGYWPAPPSMPPAGYRPPAGREPAPPPERAPRPQEGVPYTSLMDALSRATPSMLTEAEKSAPAVYLPAIRTAPARPQRRLPWRSVLAVSALVLTAGLSAYALLSHRGKHTGTSQTAQTHAGQTQGSSKWDGVWVIIPLPARAGGPLGFRSAPS